MIKNRHNIITRISNGFAPMMDTPIITTPKEILEVVRMMSEGKECGELRMTETNHEGKKHVRFDEIK